MNSFLKIVISAAVAATAFTSTAFAQNWRLGSSFGSVTLNAGFMPDPRTRTVRAGGDQHFTGSRGCPGGGWFANAPDYRLFYRAGGYVLTIGVNAPGDTMLLVNDPTATWYCNDDAYGLDPAIRFNNPSSGQYDIWVGTYNRSRVHNSVIYITER